MNDSDFGDIFSRWEKTGKGKKTGKKRSDLDMGRLLDLHPPEVDHMSAKEQGLTYEKHAAAERRRLVSLPPQDTLDLHGCTVDEAVSRTEEFLEKSHTRGLKKVLIVHGKGRHSAAGESPLRDAVRNYLSRSRIAGQTGIPPEKMGGSGAVWVLLRQRSR